MSLCHIPEKVEVMLRSLPSAPIRNVPFIDLTRSLRGRTDDILIRWRGILEGAEFVGGPTVSRLEAELQETTGCGGALACANGTDALILALQASGIRSGMKVALPNLTFWATYEAVVQIGAEPVLIDMNPDDLQLDLGELKQAHEKFRLDGAILAHLFGWASGSLDGIRAYCREEEIRLIEDAAQAFGVTREDGPIFSGSSLSTLSFYPAKVFGGAMDGGAVVGDDLDAIRNCRVLANHGRSSHYGFTQVGWNSRMSGLQAAFLLETMDGVDSSIQSRNEALQIYANILKTEIDRGSVRMWNSPSGISGNGYLSVFTLDPAKIRGVQEALTRASVGHGRVYPTTIIDQPCVPRGILRASELARSRSFSSSVINLPIFGGITPDEVDFAARAFIDALKECP